jgi:glycosyltransferase involved in cell wall biosynthesis
MHVTAVIPLCNKAPYIQRAMDSVLAQTHRDLDLIVVDDGSTDGGADVVRRCRDPRVTLVVQDNRLTGAARNAGVQRAQGDWVAFLDADDEWLPGFLEALTALAARDPGYVAVFSNRRSGTDPRPRLTTRLARGDVDDHFRFSLEHRRSGMTASSTLINRPALDACGRFVEGVAYGEDLETWARLAWTGRIGFVPEVLAVYHMDTPGGLGRRPAAEKAEYPPYVRTLRRWLSEGRVPARLVESSQAYAHWLLLQHASLLVEAGRAGDARQLLCREYPLSAWPRYGYVRTYLGAALLPALMRVPSRSQGSAQSMR